MNKKKSTDESDHKEPHKASQKEPRKQQKTSKKKDSSADIEALQQQVGELTESLQRERADSDNLRRHHEAQIQELKAHVKIEVIKELLPVMDNVDRALRHVPSELQQSDYVKGVQGIAKQFDTVLKKLGVERIKTTGEHFNPELHEAVSMDDSSGGDKEVITEELQSGFTLGDKVIRHAMVRVALK